MNEYDAASDTPVEPPQAGRRRHLSRRRASRRALLGGGAAAAAGGAVAAVFGITRLGGSNGAGQANAGQALPLPAPAPSLRKKVVSDPRQRAAHLLRRAGFGGTRAQIEEFATLSREEAAGRLLDYESIDNSALNAKLAAAGVDVTQPYDQSQPGRVAQIAQRWWLMRMAYTARPLEERMTFIWHGLLTTQLSQIGPQRAALLVRQNELFRKHALGVYDDLLQAISKDPAMLIYLNTVDSTREHPNENYARELMELFSMGAGNYTEEDVREAARAFTGWRITPPRRTGNQAQDIANYVPEFFLQQRAHDYGQKTFLGQSGPWNGDDIVRVIMQQPATGRFITRRLFTEFANYNPEPETIDGLVRTWEASGHSVKAVVREILTSDEFYSEYSYRSFVRSPIELIVGMIRQLELETDFSGLDRRSYQAMDQVLYEPPNVAGWPGGATWLSSSTFFARANFLDRFLFPRGRPIAVPALAGAATPEESVDRALQLLVDGNLPAESRDALAAYARTITRPEDRAAHVAYLVLASPQNQLA